MLGPALTLVLTFMCVLRWWLLSDGLFEDGGDVGTGFDVGLDIHVRSPMVLLSDGLFEDGGDVGAGFDVGLNVHARSPMVVIGWDYSRMAATVFPVFMAMFFTCSPFIY